MELGKGELLRTGLNALYQAIHPIHGLVWTNGTQVIITDLYLHHGEVKFGDSKVIGQFEYVCGVSWALLYMVDTPALLAVQHKKHVTVWQLCPSTTEKSKLVMSETCEIRVSLPVLPQGCVWHPRSAVLTVLTAQDVCIFPNVCCDSSQVKAEINTQGHIHCACWTQDGQRLVVAVGSSLLSYIWDSTHKTLNRCSVCPVFVAGSCIRALRATVDSQVAMATELPLDKICGLNSPETFYIPTSGEDASLDSVSVTGEVPSVDKGADVSEIQISPFFSSSSSDLLDLTHIRFSESGSKGSSLICLRKRDYLTGTGQDSSHLALVTFEKEVRKTREVTIPGILVPDVMAVSVGAQVVVVASSACNIILIYSVTPSSMTNIEQIQLESNERPKGMCFLREKLLILVGTPKSSDSAFFPSSASDLYTIRLVIRDVKLEQKSSVTSSAGQSGYSTFTSVLNKANTRKLTENLSPDFCHQNTELLLTAGASSQTGSPGRTLIKEIERPLSSICEGAVAPEALNGKPATWSASKPRPSSTPGSSQLQCNPGPEPPNLPQRKNLQREKEACLTHKKLEVLSRNLTEMQQCFSELMDQLHNGKKASPGYPLSQDPPYVHVSYQKCHVGPVTDRRAVLLCSGKLRLSTLQQAFGLSLVEMLHDSLWILLSADSEGFIPLTFTATQEIIIRDGKVSRANRPASSSGSSPDHLPAGSTVPYFQTEWSSSIMAAQQIDQRVAQQNTSADKLPQL